MEYSLVRLERKPETNMELSYICYLFIELCVCLCVTPPGKKQQKPLKKIGDWETIRLPFGKAVFTGEHVSFREGIDLDLLLF